MTRRRFLALAGGAGAVGAGFVAAPRAWDRLAPDDCGPAGQYPPVSGVKVLYERITSRHVPRPVEVAIAFPPGHTVGDPVPVCFCLPGRGGTGRGVMGPLRMHDAVAQAVRERGATPFAVVGVDGGESYWHARAGGEDRMAMLEREVIPRMTDRHGLGADGVGRAVMGWSMGGYGALRAAQRNPEMFRAVVAVSPALWLRHADAVADAFDDETDYRKNDAFAAVGALRDVPVHIDCGASDPFVAATRELIRRLPTPPTGTIDAGCHTDGYWRRVIPSEVDVLSRSLAGAE
jgi:enterochelin esterase-like enzyme